MGTQADIIKDRKRCLGFLLRPLVRFCLRNGQTYQVLIRAAKAVFIEEAERAMKAEGKKTNFSRLSAATGLSRGDVKKHLESSKEEEGDEKGVIPRVIGIWDQDRRYLTSRGEPRILSYGGEDSEFHRLVQEVTTHINPGTILFELLRTEVVEKTSRGIRLIRMEQRLADNLLAGFELAARDIDTVIEAVEENLTIADIFSNHHVRTEYDNILHRDIPQVREWFVQEGQRFHKRARDFLASLDQDLNPDPEAASLPKGGRAVLGSFSYTAPRVHLDDLRKIDS